MAVIRMPATCWYRGTPKRARTERNVRTFFTLPVEVPEVPSDGIDGRIVVRENEYGKETEMSVLGGKPMIPLSCLSDANRVAVDAEFHERLVDRFGNDTESTGYASEFLGHSVVDDIVHEDAATAQFKEIVWTNRSKSESYARNMAAQTAIIGGVVHVACKEPVHVFDIKDKTRRTEWARLSSWNVDRSMKIVARCDRLSTDGGPFDEGITIEGDTDTVRWRFRDSDANALQIARIVFSDHRLSSVASFHGKMHKLRAYASGIIDGRDGSSDMVMEAVEELLTSDARTILEDRPTLISIMSSDVVRSLTRLAHSIRNARDCDDRLRPGFRG